VRQLGGYTLTTRLGAGGMGEVWKGRRSALGGSAVDVAIKVLSPGTNDDLDARGMFLDEARLSMLLTNSNIIKVFDAAETEDKTCYLVMEWVDGLNLAELTGKMRKAGERLSDTIIAFIVGEVLKGLAHAHELRHEGKLHTIVHRDVSPQNVMLSVFGEVKIMDFGIARIASEDTSGLHVKGKIRYMAPEQLRGMSREPTVDLFAAGAILHELLDGAKFRGQILDEGLLYGMVLGGESPAMTRAADSIPKELDELRRGLLAANPRERVQTAREAFRRLATWPGYRDARFELDEIVRRFTGEVAPQPEPLPPTRSVAQPGVAASAGEVERAQAEVTDTEPLPPEVSDTDVSRVDDDSGANVAVSGDRAVAPARDNRRLWWVFGVSLSVAVGAGVLNVVLFMNGDEPESAVLKESAVAPLPDAKEPAAKDEVEEQVEEPELEGPRIDFGVRTPPVVEKPPVEVPPPVVEDEGGDESETGGTIEPPPAAKKTKVSIQLGSGVRWAEIKLGNRSFELDALGAKKSATSSFPPGNYSASFRTQVNGPWTKAGKVEVPRKSVTITLQKGGTLDVK
jgi:serine/threonine protein kinase